MTTDRLTAQELQPGMTVQFVEFSDATFGVVDGETCSLLTGSFTKSSPVATIATIEHVDQHQVGRTGFGTYRIATTDGRVFGMSNRQKARKL